MFPALIPDVEYTILSFLNARDLCHASLVNKEWNKKAFSDKIWALFYSNTYIPMRMTIKSYYNIKGITSINALMAKITQFSYKMGPQQNGKFICYFPKGTNSYIKVQVWNNQSKREYFQIEEYHWFFETFLFNGPYNDTITLNKSHTFMIQIKLPKNLNPKNITNQITGILSAQESVPSRNFKACSWF